MRLQMVGQLSSPWTVPCRLSLLRWGLFLGAAKACRWRTRHTAARHREENLPARQLRTKRLWRKDGFHMSGSQTCLAVPSNNCQTGAVLASNLDSGWRFCNSAVLKFDAGSHCSSNVSWKTSESLQAGLEVLSSSLRWWDCCGGGDMLRGMAGMVVPLWWTFQTSTCWWTPVAAHAALYIYIPTYLHTYMTTYPHA